MTSFEGKRELVLYKYPISKVHLAWHHCRLQKGFFLALISEDDRSALQSIWHLCVCVCVCVSVNCKIVSHGCSLGTQTLTPSL